MRQEKNSRATVVFSKIESFWGRPHFGGFKDTRPKPRAIPYADINLSRPTSTIHQLMIILRRVGDVNNPRTHHRPDFDLLAWSACQTFLVSSNPPNQEVRHTTFPGSSLFRSAYLSARLRVSSLILAITLPSHKPRHAPRPIRGSGIELNNASPPPLFFRRKRWRCP